MFVARGGVRALKDNPFPSEADVLRRVARMLKVARRADALRAAGAAHRSGAARNDASVRSSTPGGGGGGSQGSSLTLSLRGGCSSFRSFLRNTLIGRVVAAVRQSVASAPPGPAAPPCPLMAAQAGHH